MKFCAPAAAEGAEGARGSGGRERERERERERGREETSAFDWGGSSAFQHLDSSFFFFSSQGSPLRSPGKPSTEERNLDLDLEQRSPQRGGGGGGGRGGGGGGGRGGGGGGDRAVKARYFI